MMTDFPLDSPDVEEALASLIDLRSSENGDVKRALRVVDLIHGEYRFMRHAFDVATRGA